jgi:hypothetical protein
MKRDIYSKFRSGRSFVLGQIVIAPLRRSRWRAPRSRIIVRRMRHIAELVAARAE